MTTTFSELILNKQSDLLFYKVFEYYGIKKIG